MPIAESFDQQQNHQQHGLAVEGRGSGPMATDATKVNWNNLRCTFRPRSSKHQTSLHYRRQQAELTSDDLCWGGSASIKVNGVYSPPTSLAARPQSAGFPVRFQRSAKRRDQSSAASAAAAAAAAAEANESEALIAELWRLDDPDEDAVELDDLFDQMVKRDPSKRNSAKKKNTTSSSSNSRPGVPPHRRPRSGASMVPLRHQKSANQLYQEHLLAEVAKHRQKSAAAARPPPPELSLFIPKTRTRLCRLFTGSCLLRANSAPPPGNARSSSDFVPIARSIMPLPAELRPLSRQGWSVTSSVGHGGIVQVSPDSCRCRLQSRGGPVGVSYGMARGSLRSSAYSDNCSVCTQLRMLQLV